MDQLQRVSANIRGREIAPDEKGLSGMPCLALSDATWTGGFNGSRCPLTSQPQPKIKDLLYGREEKDLVADRRTEEERTLNPIAMPK